MPEGRSPHIRDIILRHPLISLALVAVLLAMLVVMLRGGTTPSAHSSSWEGANGIFSNGVALSTAAAPVNTLPAQPSVDIGTIPLPPSGAENGDAATTTRDDSLKALLALLSQPPKSAPANDATNPLAAYSYIPSGLTILRDPASSQSPAQTALHSYGNELGSSIQSFESLHTNSVEILKDQAEDRTSADKKAAVVQLGGDFVQLGSQLSAMDVPPDAAAYHTNLAVAYEAVGRNLQAIAQTSDDQAFLGAIDTYNASVETLSKSFTALATFFEVNNVRFSSSDTGNSFTFQSGASF